jgi:hypothetical protein
MVLRSWVRTTLVGQNHATTLATTRHCSLQTTRYSAARMLGLILKSTHMLTTCSLDGIPRDDHRENDQRWLLFSVKGGCAQRYPTHHRRASTGPARGPAHGKQTGRNGNSR